MSGLAIATAALKIADMVGLDDKVGRWIAGDNGAEVASKVVELASRATGTASPDAALAAMQSDTQHKLAAEEALRGNEVELERMAYGAVADARQMRLAELQSDSWLARNTFYLLLLGGSVFAIGYCLLVTLHPLEASGQRYADLILNVLIIGTAASASKMVLGSWQAGRGSVRSGNKLDDFNDYGKGGQ